jgi:hypothetical protein
MFADVPFLQILGTFERISASPREGRKQVDEMPTTRAYLLLAVARIFSLNALLQVVQMDWTWPHA